MQWFLNCIQYNYYNFNGRARRKEYWMFVLYYTIFQVLAIILDNILGSDFKVASGYYEVSMGYGWICLLFWILLFLPYLSVGVRRLHDINKSGLFLLVSVIPIIGGIWIIILLVTDGDKEKNIYGHPIK
jgi:uncharacterized membrane protein YhaH (DUF805 family)|tara:strand:- start:165 stop:551 length:387 start_codon:yes stop_codon:yes gene_type:complete